MKYHKRFHLNLGLLSDDSNSTAQLGYFLGSYYTSVNLLTHYLNQIASYILYKSVEGTLHFMS